MRIRRYRPGDIATLAHIQQQAARADGIAPMSEADVEQWLAQPELQAATNVFLITDDDDDLNEWGQAGTLDGLEGEAVGYTVLQLRRSQHAYHFLCEGTVLPQHRRRGAGYALLMSALNNVRVRIFEFEYEARQLGQPIYFEALLPENDPAAENLAAQFEMQRVDEQTLPGMRLYRGDL
jgi:GNAT superfamily N-acetyltransferase